MSIDGGQLDLDLHELSDRAGITPRAIRYYIAQGLLPAAGAGRGSRKYGAAYLNRLRLIRQLQRQHLSLAAIRQRFADITDEDVVGALGAMSGNEPAQTATTQPRSSAKEYLAALLSPRAIHAGVAELPATVPSNVAPPVGPEGAIGPVSDAWPQGRAQWERLTLADDVELHVRRPVSREMNRRIDRLLEVARRILHEN